MNDHNSAPSLEAAKGDYGLLDKVRTGAQLLIVGAELSPLNEAARFAALGATIAAGGNAIEAAAVFGGSTMLIEGAAATATAPLLSGDKATKVTSKVHDKLEDWNMSSVADDKFVQAGLGLVGGSAVSMAARKVSDPTISKQDLRRHGLVMSAGLGVATAAQGGLLTESITNFNTTTVGVTVIAFAGSLALAKWAKEKASTDKPSKENYLAEMASSPKGPQAEGLSPQDLEKAFADERTIFIQSKSTRAWPVLTPLENNSEYLQSFFNGNYPDKQQYYLSMPPDMTKKQMRATRKAIKAVLKTSDTQIVFDQASDDTVLQEVLEGVDGFSINEFTDEKNSTQASVIHFEGKTDLTMTNEDGDICSLREAYQKTGPIIDPENLNDATLLLSAEEIEQTKERLWEIYEGQFSSLVENHPARQIQTKDELYAMLSDPDTLTVAQKVDNEIVSFSMFVGNIDSCDWLNVDYYKDRYSQEDAHVLYFPGIATDVEKQGNKYALNLVNLIAAMIGKSGKNARIVFQCTNISADYIPKIVETATKASGMGDINMSEMYRYRYRAIES